MSVATENNFTSRKYTSYDKSIKSNFLCQAASENWMKYGFSSVVHPGLSQLWPAFKRLFFNKLVIWSTHKKRAAVRVIKGLDLGASRGGGGFRSLC